MKKIFLTLLVISSTVFATVYQQNALKTIGISGLDNILFSINDKGNLEFLPQFSWWSILLVTFIAINILLYLVIKDNFFDSVLENGTEVPVGFSVSFGLTILITVLFNYFYLTDTKEYINYTLKNFPQQELIIFNDVKKMQLVKKYQCNSYNAYLEASEIKNELNLKIESLDDKEVYLLNKSIKRLCKSI